MFKIDILKLLLKLKLKSKQKKIISKIEVKKKQT